MLKKYLVVFLISSIVTYSNAGRMSDDTKTIALDLKNFDTTVRPQDDFFQYVNGNWVKKTKIPKDKSSWGVFTEIADLTNKKSIEILDSLNTDKEYINNHEAQIIRTLYNSFIDTKERNIKGLAPIKKELDLIDSIQNLQDLQNYIIEQGKLGKGVNLYSWEISADLKKSTDNAVYLGSAGTILAKDYYQKTNEHNEKIINEYQKFVSKIFKLLGNKNPDNNAKEIVNLEKNIAKYLLTNEESRDPNLIYNKIKANKLNTLSKHINLKDYLTKINVNTKEVIIPEIKYFQNIDEIVNENNLDIIKNYLKLSKIISNSNYLDDTLYNIVFDFFNKKLNGQQEPEPIKRRALNTINRADIDQAFGKIYVKKYYSEQEKEQMKELIHYLKLSFAEHIKNNTWMSKTTKNKALDKLSAFNVKIAYPDKWKDYSELNIPKNEKDLIKINSIIQEWYYKKQLKKIGQKVDKDEWFMGPQVVNAYYSPSNNEIVFPAAILQPPYFNPKADPAINFGAIGGVIGHEITHGFDDSGSKFDKNGNIKNWWSKKDKANFDKLTQRLADRYSTYEPIKGYPINGKFTLGENIADLGGVNIAFDALLLYLKDKGEVNPIDNFTQKQRFFLSWTTVWRNKSTDEYLKNQVKVDPHSPAYFRSFAPLVNVNEFYEAFDIKEGDKLYLKPDDRIKIW